MSIPCKNVVLASIDSLLYWDNSTNIGQKWFRIYVVDIVDFIGEITYLSQPLSPTILWKDIHSASKVLKLKHKLE